MSTITKSDLLKYLAELREKVANTDILEGTIGIAENHGYVNIQSWDDEEPQYVPTGSRTFTIVYTKIG